MLVSALPSNVVDDLEIQTAAPGSDPNQTSSLSQYYGLLNTRAMSPWQ